MQETEILRRLILELKTTIENYQAQAEAFDSPKDNSIFELLARRCARFETEIEKATQEAVKIDLETPIDDQIYQAWSEIKAREQIFISIEARESRLERLYREVLRNKTIPPGIRKILEAQFEAIYRWHNFVITEEVEFIFGSEVKISSELSEV